MNYSNSERNKFIDNLRVDIDRNLIIQIEKEIECDIIKAIVLNVIKLRDSDIYVRDLLDYKIDSYPISEGYYHSGSSVEENIVEIVDYYSEYLGTKISYLIEEGSILTDTNQITEFIEELMEEDKLKINYKNLSLIKEDRLIDDIIDKYRSKIIEYRLAITEYNLFKETDYPIITDYISEFIVKN